MDQISVQVTVQTVLDPVFDAESDGELGFEPKPRPDTVMWIANLQLTGGSNGHANGYTSRD